MALTAIQTALYRTGMYFLSWSLRANIDKKLRNLENIIAKFEEFANEFEEVDSIEFRLINNHVLFLLILDYELALQLYDAAIEVDSKRKNFRVRQLCLLLHEAIDDLPQVLGKEFRTLVNSLNESATHMKAVDLILKKMMKLVKTHSGLIRTVRTHAVAHKDHDAFKQLEIHAQIPLGEIQSVAMDFDLLLAQLSETLMPVLQALLIEKTTKCAPRRRGNCVIESKG